MGKKIFAALVVAVCVGFAGYNVMQSQNDKGALSDLLMANVEALAADDEANSNGNSGPSELYDCPWIGTGDGTRCKCENNHSCTAVLCR